MQLITREQLKTTLDANDDSKLVMVVGPWEFRARHIPGSLGFPSPRSALAALNRDDQIILHANNHHRGNTTAAAAALRAHGYRNVRSYPGGLADWEAAGYPVEGDSVGAGTDPRWPPLAQPPGTRAVRRLPPLRQRLVRVWLATRPCRRPCVQRPSGPCRSQVSCLAGRKAGRVRFREAWAAGGRRVVDEEAVGRPVAAAIRYHRRRCRMSSRYAGLSISALQPQYRRLTVD
jgi:rhodanese-related sulfurtransferase